MAEEYVREWPRGCLGYANEQRRNATVLQPAVPTVQSEADRIVCSDRTLRRWQARVRREGHCDRRGRGGGRRLKLSCMGAYLIFWWKQLFPEATFIKVACVVKAGTGETLRQSQYSKELKRLGFTRKRLAHLSRRRCEADRVRWWTQRPDPAALVDERGCFGLDSRLLVDIDEKPIWSAAACHLPAGCCASAVTVSQLTARAVVQAAPHEPQLRPRAQRSAGGAARCSRPSRGSEGDAAAGAHRSPAPIPCCDSPL